MTRRRLVLAGTLTVLVGWLVVITVLIAVEPDPGVDSPAELRARLAAALSEHDATGLERVLDYPVGARADFAKEYASAAAEAGVHAVTVRLLPDESSPRQAVVSGMLGDGTPFSYPLAVRGGGNWAVTALPPLP
ncbi:hypothetical protein [Amycolatopsis suaedae]|uniref:DUF4878 domain-containing protein n=1 Tax=Amycolatopsis suaedae TaxID=2510978 RepID=A0A4V2ELT2_9PSEU|nr:hypothetical protein [Amycolatopsis suaedae]RZQ62655.1 hypothetical protein EWH70_16975 [Amycolatopsis suaedae]